MTEEFFRLKDQQISLLQEEPRNGAHGMKVGFIHPKSSLKVLIELCEKN
ncbi:hypothetical protein [Tepidibacillus marianensis]